MNDNFALLFTLLFATASAQQLQPEGFGNLLETTEATFEQLTLVENNLKSALSTCSALVEGTSDDANASYRRLESAVDVSKKEYKDAEKTVKKLDDASNKYFAQWERSFDTMNDIDRETSATLRNDIWSRYQDVLEDGQAITESNLHPLFVDLERMVKELHGNLDATSLASHKDSLAKLDEKAKAWFEDNVKRQKQVKDHLNVLTER